MAADTYLLERAQIPTLRLYGWKGPWISLGYAQKDFPSCLSVSLPVVRRPSGGRAVLHHHEITYAIVLPEVYGKLGEVYQFLTGVWLRILSKLDAGVSLASYSNKYSNIAGKSPSCYQLSQRGEIQLHGKKLVGSAQLCRGRRLLQHGSVPTALSPYFSLVFPEAKSPAVLPTLTMAQVIANFPYELELAAWTVEELKDIDEKNMRNRA